MLGLVQNIDQSDRAISTGVAHFLHTEGVTGSNPVSPIIKNTDKPDQEAFACSQVFSPEPRS